MYIYIRIYIYIYIYVYIHIYIYIYIYIPQIIQLTSHKLRAKRNGAGDEAPGGHIAIGRIEGIY